MDRSMALIEGLLALLGVRDRPRKRRWTEETVGPLAGEELDPLTRYLATTTEGYRGLLMLVIDRLEKRPIERFILPPFSVAKKIRRLITNKLAAADDLAIQLAFDPARRLPLKGVPARFGLATVGGRPGSSDVELAAALDPLVAAFRRRDLRTLLDLATRLRPGGGWRRDVLRDMADFLLATEFFVADLAVAAGGRLVAAQAGRDCFVEEVHRLVLEKLAIAQVKTGDYAAARETWRRWSEQPARGQVPDLFYAELFAHHDPEGSLAALDRVFAESERLPQSFAMLRGMLTLERRNIDAAEAAVAPRGRLGPDSSFARYNVALAGSGMTIARRFLDKFYSQHDLARPRFARGDRYDVNIMVSDVTEAEVVPAAADGPLVTVIVTAFNVAGTIAAAVASLRAQTWHRIEIIVVDDCSTDGTTDVVRDLAARDPRVRLIVNRSNIGTYLSRNRAMAQARGAYITFQDADDWSHPQRIERHVDLMESRPDLVMTRSHWIRMASDGHIPMRRWSRSFAHPNPSSLFLRRSALSALGYFDAVRVDADFEFTRRAHLLFGEDAIETIAMPLSIGFVGDVSLTRSGPTAIDAEGWSPVRAAYKRAWVESYGQRIVAGTMTLPALPAAPPYPVPPEMAVDLTGVAAWFGEGAEEVPSTESGWGDRPPFWFGISLISRTASADWERTVTVFRNTLRAILAQDDPDFRVVVSGHDRPDIVEMDDPRVSFIVSDRPPAAKPSEFRADKMWKRRLIFHRIREAGGGYFMPVDADDLVSRRLVSYVRARGVRDGFVVMQGYVLDWSRRLLAAVPGAWSAPFERVCGTSAVFLLRPEQIPLLHQNDMDDVAQALLGPHANWRLTAEEVGRPLEEVDFPAAVYVINTAVNLSFARQRAGGRAERMLENVARAEIPVTPEIVAEFALDELFPAQAVPPRGEAR